MARYRAHDAQLRRLHLSILSLEQEIASAEHCFDAVRARLVEAQAGSRLASLSALTTPSGQDRRAVQAVRRGRADPRGGRG
jgi:phage shock protein A